jgi:hypothetical protein
MQAGEYTWWTYKEVYDVVMKLAASMDKSGIKQVRTARNSHRHCFSSSMMICTSWRVINTHTHTHKMNVLQHMEASIMHADSRQLVWLTTHIITCIINVWLLFWLDACIMHAYGWLLGPGGDLIDTCHWER